MLWNPLKSSRLARTGLTVAVLGASVAAGTVPSALARHTAGTANAPVSGGTLNYRDLDSPGCVDPLIAPTTVEGLADYPTFDNVVLLDGKGVPRPDLATSWKFSHGGKWITFKLRHGVKFSNGNPFNASVIRFNMQRVLGPVGQAAGMSSFLGPLKTVTADSTYQVTFKFNAPYRPALPNLANDSLGIIDPISYNKEGKTKYCQYPVGTGPFKIQSFGSGGTQIVLTRNPFHNWETPWAQNKGRAYVSKLVLKPILSDSTAVSELLSGGVDISAVAGTQLDRVKGNSNIALHRVLGQFLTSFGFNTAHAPFNNAAVRKAMSQAIDRSAVIKASQNGLGQPATSLIGHNVPYYDPGTKSLTPKYNVSAAQAVLSANHVTGPYTLLSNNRPATTAADELIQAELEAVGVKVNIVSKPGPDFISLAQKGDFDVILDSWYSADADVLYNTFDSSQSAGGGLNFTNFKSATLDSLLEKGRTTFNNKLAASYYAQAQRFILKNYLADPLYIPITEFGVRKRVHGFHTDATGLWPLFQDLWIK
jgi:peptide/nickel transport system substrate-binding protein